MLFHGGFSRSSLLAHAQVQHDDEWWRFADVHIEICTSAWSCCWRELCITHLLLYLVLSWLHSLQAYLKLLFLPLLFLILPTPPSFWSWGFRNGNWRMKTDTEERCRQLANQKVLGSPERERGRTRTWHENRCPGRTTKCDFKSSSGISTTRGVGHPPI